MALRLRKEKFQELQSQKKSPKQHTILIVDDEEGNIDALSRTLDKKYELVTAKDGLDALELIKSMENPERIHLIISDQRMPKMGGADFLKATIPIIPHAIRIILTGFTDINVVIDAINEGQIYKFISKPIDPSDLLVTVKRALEVYEMEAETQELNKELNTVNKELKTLNSSLEEKVKERTVELEQINKQKDKFFSIIGHDLKAPFTLILGYFEVLEEDIDAFSKDDLKRIARKILRSGKNVFKLLTNLLEWSRLQMGQMEFSPKLDNLKAALESNIELLKPVAEQKEITLELEGEESFLLLDKYMIQLVARNLINNAIKFTPKGGHVTLFLKEEADELIVATRDTGIGMSIETLEKLFRIDAKHTTLGTENETGTGLGLNLCKEMITRHGGKIWVESELGQGSTFFFSLPKNQEKSSTKET